MENKEQVFDIPLHDIKPIVEVQEYSLYYFLGLVFVGVLLLGVLVYLMYKWRKAKNAFNQRKEHYKIINSLNLSDTKHAAYAITAFGATFKDDSQKHSEMYANIIQRLEGYKYKKEVEEFDSEVMGYIEVYKGMIDV